MTLENPHVTSSNGGSSIVMLVFGRLIWSIMHQNSASCRSRHINLVVPEWPLAEHLFASCLSAPRWANNCSRSFQVSVMQRTLMTCRVEFQVCQSSQAPWYDCNSWPGQVSRIPSLQTASQWLLLFHNAWGTILWPPSKTWKGNGQCSTSQETTICLREWNKWAFHEVGSQVRSEPWILWVLLRCYHTLPETNISPENGWLEDDRFLLGFGPIFRCELLVSGRVIMLIKGQELIWAS